MIHAMRSDGPLLLWSFEYGASLIAVTDPHLEALCDYINRTPGARVFLR